MPPNFQRFLPIVLIGALAIFVLPAVLKKHPSGLSASTKATTTLDAMNLIDKAEQRYSAAHSSFTPHLADLVGTSSRLRNDLAIGLTVQLDVSTDGKSFVARVVSDNLSLLRIRTGDKLTAQNCLVLKKGKGVKCPLPISK